ncbi:MAG: glycerol-3-phosphate O-acyltransferase [Thermoanaerobaculia bacterium]|jgi:glycerol-3-phosphate O-acyltransferase|nr:glycerol-3-phosphate O-acyltransferase [Thermoanaerobaculia bacterium]
MTTFVLIGALVVLLVLGALALVVGNRHARRFQHARRIRVDRFKLKRRHAAIDLEVFGSREVVDAVRTYAKDHHVSIEEATHQARVYLREIVPKFNLLAYYRVGAPLARGIMHFLYRPVVEHKTLRDFSARAPKNAVVVYLINHRSNADYVLVAHMLFKFVSLSYAVGEWARVWPLNHLFKWFGGYFIRRRYREPLYHAVLSSFVSTITKNGVTQGVFIEGGLTRDGAFQKPKLGMLDYIVGGKRDPDFTAPLFLIPTAINYDRVLEDRNLTEELVGKEDRRSKSEKLKTTSDFLFRSLFRSIFKRFKRYGYAVVTFGTPVSVDDFARDHPAMLSPSYEERKGAMTDLAELVMTEISNALPVTPVTLLARVFADRSDTPLTDVEIVDAIDGYRTTWHNRVWLLREKTGEEIWRAGRRVVELRHLIQPAERWRSDLFEGSGVPVIEEAWEWNPRETLLRDYYANSLMTFEEVKQRGWPERKRP